ncbi:hypothetical protein G6F31_016650 [Rhizopus arrhizus]|nr:hypothetical protein G6F31_016650 [Rhizopus arrhizus]
MAVGPVAVGVVHRDTRGVLGIERGVQAGGVVEAQLGLIAVARQARQAVAAEARIVSVPEIAEAGLDATVHGRAGVVLGDEQVWHRLQLHAQQFVVHVCVVAGQFPAAQHSVATCAQLQRGGGLVLHRHRRALAAGGRSIAWPEVLVRAPDHRPRVRCFHRTAEVAEPLRLRAVLPGEAQSRRIVPVVVAQAAATVRPGAGARST